MRGRSQAHASARLLSTAMLCLGAAGRDDHALDDFFDQTVSFIQHGDHITFTGPHGTATFTRAQ